MTVEEQQIATQETGPVSERVGSSSGKSPSEPLGGRGTVPAIIELAHPLPVLFTVAVAIAFVIATRVPLFGLTPLKVIIIVLANQIAISLYNDVCDAAMDRTASRRRAIERGLVRAGAIETVALGCAALGVAISMSMGWLSFALVLAATMSGLLYSAWFKRSQLSWVPFSAAFALLPIWEVVVLRPDVGSVWYLYLLGVPAGAAIYLADAVPDVSGDLNSGSNSISVRLGAERGTWTARSLAAITAILAIGLAFWTSVPGFAVAGGMAGLILSLSSIRLSEKGLRYVLSASVGLAAVGWVAALCG